MNKLPKSGSDDTELIKFFKFVIFSLWLGVVVMAFIFREKLTVDYITNISSKDLLTTVLILLFLFSLKSVTVVLYSGIFYVAAGIMLPIIPAVLTSVAGIILMSFIPYMLGRVMAHGSTDMLIEKYPKLARVRDFRKENDFIFSFLARVISVVPNDPFSAYMGAAHANLWEYLLGSVLGLLPTAIPLTIVGRTAGDWDSPAFLISVAIKIVLVILSLLHIKKNGKQKAQ